MSAGRFDGWKATSSGITVSAAKRLKMLEDETLKLKKLLAEQMLAEQMPECAVDTPFTARQVIAGNHREGVQAQWRRPG